MSDHNRASASAGAKSVCDIAGRGLADNAVRLFAPVAELSHLAALAAERLEQLANCASTNQSEFAEIIAMMRAAQKAGHLAFLKQHGREADYQAIGKKVAAQYRTPSGRWRLRKTGAPR